MARRFAARRATIDSDLRSILRKMRADALRVEESMAGAKVTVAFRRGARWYTFECEKYQHVDDNYRAIQLTIDYLWRALEHYGVTREEADSAPLPQRKEKQRQADDAFDTLFLPFTATPDSLPLLLGNGQASWWELLAVPRDASVAAIKSAYRALVRDHHPDATHGRGDTELMKRVNAAYQAALAERGGA